MPYNGNGSEAYPVNKGWNYMQGEYDYGGIDPGVNRIYQKSPFAVGFRRTLNWVAIFLCWILPVSLFAVLCAVMSFSLRYQSPAIAYGVMVLAALVVLVCLAFACISVMRKVVGDPTRQPNWYIFLFLSMLIAWILACVLGNRNYNNNMKLFYDCHNLATFTAIDPSRIRGEQIMDAGVIEFIKGVKLNLTQAMGFKSDDVYCVAPIVYADETPAQYDFWAVGTNCCSGATADFHCKNFNNPYTNGALRIINGQHRAMYRLAVQQAEATYHIKATHPLFFQWTVDPVGEMYGHRSNGISSYCMGLLGYALAQAFFVACAATAFGKLGFY